MSHLITKVSRMVLCMVNFRLGSLSCVCVRVSNLTSKTTCNPHHSKFALFLLFEGVDTNTFLFIYYQFTPLHYKQIS